MKAPVITVLTILLTLTLGGVFFTEKLLIWGIVNDDIKAVKVALFLGAKPDCRDQHGRTPLMLAVFNGSVPNVLNLISYGANIDALDELDNKRPIHYATSPKTLRLLLLFGANPLPEDDAGRTPRSLALSYGDNEMLFLIDQAVAERSRTQSRVDSELKNITP